MHDVGHPRSLQPILPIRLFPPMVISTWDLLRYMSVGDKTCDLESFETNDTDIQLPPRPRRAVAAADIDPPVTRASNRTTTAWTGGTQALPDRTPPTRRTWGRPGPVLRARLFKGMSWPDDGRAVQRHRHREQCRVHSFLFLVHIRFVFRLLAQVAAVLTRGFERDGKVPGRACR